MHACPNIPEYPRTTGVVRARAEREGTETPEPAENKKVRERERARECECLFHPDSSAPPVTATAAEDRTGMRHRHRRTKRNNGERFRSLASKAPLSAQKSPIAGREGVRWVSYPQAPGLRVTG